MTASKKRNAPDRSPQSSQRPEGSSCSCVTRRRSNGICDLDVWQGTTIDAEAAQSSERLLRLDLPVVKCKQWSIFGFPGHLYHLIVLGWIPLLSVFIGSYVAAVGLFALLFAACDGVRNDYPTNARDFFNLSLQTLSTIGFGSLYPANSCANWIAVVESFVSMLLTSFMTGIAFVKFARPYPNMIFSDVFTVSQGESEGLQMRFRVANGTRREFADRGDILDVSFKLILMRVETGRNGEKKLCYYDLKLETARYISLRLEAELVHDIDASSPFFGQSSEEITRSDFLLVFIASGLDENLHDMVHKKREYNHEAMQWGANFLPMLQWDASHKFVTLDLANISLVVSSPISYPIDVGTISTQPQEEHVEIPTMSFRTHEGFRGGGGESLKQREVQATLRHRLTNGSVVETNDYDEETRVTRICESWESDGTNSGSDNAERGLVRGGGNVFFYQRPSYRHHSHDLNGERPMSLLQRTVRIRNHPRSLLSNGVYYGALGASWPCLLSSLLAVYVAVIAAIALAISVSVEDPLEQNVDTGFAGKYELVFFFCAQTISTIGYGSLSPKLESDAVNFFVFFLAIAGIMLATLLTGLTWAKFSIPKSSTLLYSDVLLHTSYHGQRAVMFRAANNRQYGVLVEGSFRMSVVVLNRHLGRRETHGLLLVRNVWPMVQLCNTVTHIIDENSPLYDISTDELLSGDHFFVVLFTGLDSVISDTMVARKTYHACDILVGHHFVDNIKLAADGLYIDLDAINDTVLRPDADLLEVDEDSTGEDADNATESNAVYSTTATGAGASDIDLIEDSPRGRFALMEE